MSILSSLGISNLCPDQISVITSGFFTLFTITLALWALYWSGVIKDGDSKVFSLLHFFSSLLIYLVLVLFGSFTKETNLGLGLIFLIVTIINVIISFALPSLRRVSISHLRKVYKKVTKINSLIDYQRNFLLGTLTYSSYTQDQIEDTIAYFLSYLLFTTGKTLVSSVMKTQLFDLNLFVYDRDLTLRRWLPSYHDQSVGQDIRVPNDMVEPWVDDVAKFVASQDKKLEILDFSNDKYYSILPQQIHDRNNFLEVRGSAYFQPILVNVADLSNQQLLIGVLVLRARKTMAWESKVMTSTMGSFSKAVESLLLLQKKYTTR